MFRLARGPRVAALALTLSLLTSVAAGQDSRAEEIARKQAEKSQSLAPNTAGAVERALDWFEDHFTDPNTAYLTFGSIYPTGGFAPGVAVRRAIGPARLNFGGAYSVRSYKLGHASLGFPELAGNKIELETHARWTDATQVPFYGFGNDSIADDRVNYGLRSLDLGGSVTLKPVGWYRIGAGIASSQFENREGAGRRPSVETRYSPTTAPGLFAEPRYRHARAFTAIDWRESPGYTRRGGLYAVSLEEFRDSDDTYTFRLAEAELRQYIPLLKEHWVLVFRALAQTTDVDSGQVIPYFLMPSLGGANTLRGYGDFRFQDRHLLVFSAEYRWLPSRIIDMAIFVDSGKVTAERRDLDLDGLKTTYGIGIRFHGPTFTPLRADLARGDDGIRLHLTGSLTF